MAAPIMRGFTSASARRCNQEKPPKRERIAAQASALEAQLATATETVEYERSRQRELDASLAELRDELNEEKAENAGFKAQLDALSTARAREEEQRASERAREEEEASRAKLARQASDARAPVMSSVWPSQPKYCMSAHV